jgi:hypothetical protein
MSASGISSDVAINPSVQSVWQQRMQDFQSLNDALASGNLPGAQSAFATFQQHLQSFAMAAQSGPPFAGNAAAATDYQSLQTSLQSGDLSGAQQAFASLKQDMHTGGAAHRHHLFSSASYDSAIQSATSTIKSPIESLKSLLNIKA